MKVGDKFKLTKNAIENYKPMDTKYPDGKQV